MNEYTKWTACWGTAASISERTIRRYTRDLTLRYPIRMCFSGSRLRFHFSNFTGTETVHFYAYAARGGAGSSVEEGTSQPVFMDGSAEICVLPGREALSDPLEMNITAGDTVTVSLYFKDFTQMNTGTLLTGPLSKGWFSYGDQAQKAELPHDLTRPTGWFYFLNTIDIYTEKQNRALICYGDSITAQDWPDELALRAEREGCRHVSVIRRAVCGTRILRQYDCITYAAYGIKGSVRFPIESEAAGADTILIQHGINDIIHPVGTDVNEFRPWSDLPTAEELEKAYREIYIEEARKKGLSVWTGTLLPIYGWRTYAPFREELKNSFNRWLREDAPADGCVDFDAAVRDPDHPERFRTGFDSGDHLHPSKEAYRQMAAAVPAELLGPAK